MAQPRVLVIGGGLAGLAATMRMAELGAHVDLVSLVPVKRSHSVCAQGGIFSMAENNPPSKINNTRKNHEMNMACCWVFVNVEINNPSPRMAKR